MNRMMNRILIVDPDPRTQRAVLRMLESEGYEIHTAADGPTGLNAFRTKPPIAVILALELPGLSGKEVCRQMKEEKPEIPIFILSPKHQCEEKMFLLGLGANGYFKKPFDPEHLLARILGAIRQPGISNAIHRLEPRSLKRRPG